MFVVVHCHAQSIHVRKFVMKAVAMIAQFENLPYVGAVKRRRNLPAAREILKTAQLREKCPGLDDLHATKFVKGMLSACIIRLLKLLSLLLGCLIVVSINAQSRAIHRRVNQHHVHDRRLT